jgi:phosphoglycerate kinase
MAADFLSLDRLDVARKRVLVRVDLNVPVKDGTVTDATRIARLVPTIRLLSERGARTVLLSHFGRPKGKPDPQFSLRPLVGPLSEAIGQPVVFASDCAGPSAARVVESLGDGEVALLENVRFEPGEEANDGAFARRLAALGDLYVNDAFSAAHRAHASTEALAHLLPNAAGLLMQAELEALAAALDYPKRPVAALVGGAKVSTKIDLLGSLVGKVDHLIIGGAMANTMLLARGVEVGRSLVERDLVGTAHDIFKAAEIAGCRVHLPSDAVVAAALQPGEATAIVPIDAIPADRMVLDVGPRTVREIGDCIAGCRTLVWNGPVGAFETPPFDQGTSAIAARVAELVANGTLLAVAGGGDTVAALAHAGVEGRLSYVSTAGGAFLEWLEGKTLPGVAALAIRA